MKSKLKESQKPPEKTKDEAVEEMLQTWDIVRCRICGRKISMLNAKSINSGEYFICREHNGR
jgi:hypothetical protein